MDNLETVLVAIFGLLGMIAILLTLIWKELRLNKDKKIEDKRLLPVTLPQEVRVIEKQVFVPMPTPAPVVEEKKIEEPLVVPTPPVIGRPLKKFKPEDVNDLSICTVCNRPIGGAGLIAKGIIYCSTCYKKRRK